MGTESAPHGRGHVQSLDRGLAVIRAFDSARPSMTLSEVARASGLNRATARRLLHTLVELGYIRSDGRIFSLRPRLLQLGHAYLASLILPKIAQPHLVDLVAQLHESCSVSVLDEGDVVYVARVHTHRIMTVAINVGTRFPAYATSMGRVLLADQPADRLAEYIAHTPLETITAHTITDREILQNVIIKAGEDGFALVDQELEIGLRSLAVPIRDACGSVVAAMNVSMHATGPVGSVGRDMLPALRAAASHVEADLRETA